MKEYIKTNELIEWLKGEKYIYYDDNLKDFIEYGSPDDYGDEDFYKLHKWEYSRNDTIDKIIYALKYDMIKIGNEDID
jgi:hypothetical protein